VQSSVGRGRSVVEVKNNSVVEERRVVEVEDRRCENRSRKRLRGLEREEKKSKGENRLQERDLIDSVHRRKFEMSVAGKRSCSMSEEFERLAVVFEREVEFVVAGNPSWDLLLDLVLVLLQRFLLHLSS